MRYGRGYGYPRHVIMNKEMHWYKSAPEYKFGRFPAVLAWPKYDTEYRQWIRSGELLGHWDLVEAVWSEGGWTYVRLRYAVDGWIKAIWKTRVPEVIVRRLLDDAVERTRMEILKN